MKPIMSENSIDIFKEKQLQIATKLHTEKISELDQEIENLTSKINCLLVKKFNIIYWFFFGKKQLLELQEQKRQKQFERQNLIVFGKEYFLANAYDFLVENEPKLINAVYQQKTKELPTLIKLQRKQQREYIREQQLKQIPLE